MGDSLVRLENQVTKVLMEMTEVLEKKETPDLLESMAIKDPRVPLARKAKLETMVTVDLADVKFVMKENVTVTHTSSLFTVNQTRSLNVRATTEQSGPGTVSCL